jgi:cell division protein FtsL
MLVFVVMVLLVATVSLLMYKSLEREHNLALMEAVRDLRRQVADEEARYEAAHAKCLKESSYDNVVTFKRIGEQCRYWRDVLRKHEDAARSSGLCC